MVALLLYLDRVDKTLEKGKSLLGRLLARNARLRALRRQTTGRRRRFFQIGGVFFRKDRQWLFQGLDSGKNSTDVNEHQ